MPATMIKPHQVMAFYYERSLIINYFKPLQISWSKNVSKTIWQNWTHSWTTLKLRIIKLLEKTCICHKTPKKQHHSFPFDFPTIFILSLPHELWFRKRSTWSCYLSWKLSVNSVRFVKEAWTTAEMKPLGHFIIRKFSSVSNDKKNTNGSWWNFCALSNEKNASFAR